MANVLSQPNLIRLFQLSSSLGAGGHGCVFRGKEPKKKTEVAIKFEARTVAKPLLKKEMELYQCVKGGEGIPRMYSLYETETHTALTMDLLGDDLFDLLKKCGGTFSVKTVSMIGLQILDRLEYIHSHNIIHRDLKPENLTIGQGEDKNVIHLIDFGLARKFQTSEGENHIPFSNEKRKRTGTRVYMSLNVNNYCENSRRDDMESLGYVLVALLKGQLPWEDVKGVTPRQRLEEISNIKRNYSLVSLCEGIPLEFRTFLEYSRQLEFTEKPDYQFCKNLFERLMEANGYINDSLFDWTNMDNDRSREEVEKTAKCFNFRSIFRKKFHRR